MKIYKYYPCQSKAELRMEAERVRCELNAKLNNNSCYGLDKNKRREYNKQYQQANWKENYQTIKEYRNEKITCECGAIVSRHNMSCHRKTQKHLNYITP
tara:strand:+ start:108 stop:404 length:297 start_codon:yes stop_codon:yes gene_type:complete